MAWQSNKNLKKTTIAGAKKKRSPDVDAVVNLKTLYLSEIYESRLIVHLQFTNVRLRLFIFSSPMYKYVYITKKHPKKSPGPVKYCNTIKVEVDILDQNGKATHMQFEMPVVLRKWSVAIFFKIFNLACINTYIIHKGVTKGKLLCWQYSLEHTVLMIYPQKRQILAVPTFKISASQTKPQCRNDVKAT